MRTMVATGIVLSLTLLTPLMLGPRTRPSGSLGPFTGVAAAPLVVDELSGVVFVGTQRIVNNRAIGGGVVRLFDGRTGTLLHSSRLGRHYPAALAVDGVLGRVVVTTSGCLPAGGGFGCASEPAGVSILDTRTGAVLWATALPHPPASSVVLNPQQFLPDVLVVPLTHRAFVTSCSIVTSFTLSGQRELHTVLVPGCARVPVADGPAAHVIISSSAGNPNTQVVIGGVSGLDAATGALLYQDRSHAAQRARRIDEQSLSHAVVDTTRGRAVIVGDFPSQTAEIVSPIVTILDARNGKVVRIVPLDPRARPSEPIIDERNGRAYVSVSTLAPVDGVFHLLHQVCILDTMTGRLISTLTVTPASLDPDAPLLADDERTGRVFAVSAAWNGKPGSLSILDARRGVVLHTGVLSVDPQLVRVIPTTGRLFVFGRDDSAVQVLDSATGATLSRISLGKPLTRGLSSLKATVDARTGRVFVVHHLDTLLSVLDARTGRVLRTTSLAA